PIPLPGDREVTAGEFRPGGAAGRGQQAILLTHLTSSRGRGCAPAAGEMLDRCRQLPRRLAPIRTGRLETWRDDSLLDFSLGGLCRPGGDQGRVSGQYPLVQFPQARPRLDAEFLDQDVAGALVG